MRLFATSRTGGELCTARLLQCLSDAGHEILVIGRGRGPARHARNIRYLSVGDCVPAFNDMSLAQQVGMPLAALAQGRPTTTQRLLGEKAASRVRHQLASKALQMEVLIVDHLQALSWIESMLPALPPPIVIMHNLESDGYEERAQGIAGLNFRSQLRRWFLRRESRLLRRLEHLALKHASVIACLSEADGLRFRELAAAAGVTPEIEVLPGYSVQTERAEAPGSALDEICLTRPASRVTSNAHLGAPSADARLIGMIGTWTWEPNRVGLQWMLESVHPHLPANCHLVVAGSGLDGLPVPERTVVLGKIEHIRSLYDAVDLVAIPSIRGSGVHEKAIEAIGLGKTVVSTSHAMRGLMPNLPGNVHVADSAADFAQACADVPLRCADAGDRTWKEWTERRSIAYRHAMQRCLSTAFVNRSATTLRIPVSLGEEPA